MTDTREDLIGGIISQIINVAKEPPRHMIFSIYGGAVALRLPTAVYKANYEEIHYTALTYILLTSRRRGTASYSVNRKVPERTALAYS